MLDNAGTIRGLFNIPGPLNGSTPDQAMLDFMVENGSLPPESASGALLLALVANTVSKGVAALVSGGAAFALRMAERDRPAALAQFVERAHRDLEGVAVERAEPLVDDEGVELDATGAGGDDFGEPEGEGKGAEEGLAAGE